MSTKAISRTTESQPLQPFWCLSGCTAVGKTELALAWAEENDAEIVNCDSLLFYRGMDIGTAKPTQEERKRVRHHLIDIAEPTEQLDIGIFLSRAEEVIRAIQSYGKKVLVTGGSGFYLKAFFSPVVDDVVVPDEVRARAGRLVEQSLDEAVDALRELNPGGVGNLDTCNPRRVVKALERCWASGLTLAQLRVRFESQTNALIDAPKSLTVLERDKDELNERIRLRVGMMLGAGLIEEVASLSERGFEANPSAAHSIGYRETIAYLKGEYGVEELEERIVVNTRRLAKKQRTWFRTQLPCEQLRRLDLSSNSEPRASDLFGPPVQA